MYSPSLLGHPIHDVRGTHYVIFGKQLPLWRHPKKHTTHTMNIAYKCETFY